MDKRQENANERVHLELALLRRQANKLKTLQITIKSKRNYFHGRLAGQLMQLSFSPLRHQINIEFLHLRQAMLGCSGWLDHQHSF